MTERAAIEMHARKKGSILVLALIVSAVASIAGMHLMIVADLRMRRSHALARIQDALRVSSSGLQYARIRLGSNQGYAGGSVQDPLFASATFNLDVGATGVMKAHASSVGIYSDATFAMNADLRAPGHPVLAFNVFSATTIQLTEATLKGYLRANGDVTGSGSVDFFGALQTTQSSSVTNKIAPGQVEKVPGALGMPASPVATYQAFSASLVNPPVVGGVVTLSVLSLRPNNNPYGSTNARGAYVIDAGDRDVEIADVYVNGSLTIRNARTVHIERGCWLKASDPALATLIVQGSLNLEMQSDLREASLIADMNGDGDSIDVIPSRTEGLVYVTGSFSGTESGTLKGCVMANSVTIIGYPKVETSDTFATSPIEGFTVPGPWNLIAGTIQQGGG